MDACSAKLVGNTCCTSGLECIISSIMCVSKACLPLWIYTVITHLHMKSTYTFIQVKLVSPMHSGQICWYFVNWRQFTRVLRVLWTVKPVLCQHWWLTDTEKAPLLTPLVILTRKVKAIFTFLLFANYLEAPVYFPLLHLHTYQSCR